MTLTVDLTLDGIRVLSVETNISHRMAGAFLDANSEILEEGIRDLRRQIEATTDLGDSRLEIGLQLQFALGCSMLSTLSGEVSPGDEA